MKKTKKLSKAEQDFLCKAFPITSICRTDLKDSFTDEEINKLDDGDMSYLASKMADAYLETSFWVDMRIIAEYILEDTQ